METGCFGLAPFQCNNLDETGSSYEYSTPYRTVVLPMTLYGMAHGLQVL